MLRYAKNPVLDIVIPDFSDVNTKGYRFREWLDAFAGYWFDLTDAHVPDNLPLDCIFDSYGRMENPYVAVTTMLGVPEPTMSESDTFDYRTVEMKIVTRIAEDVARRFPDPFDQCYRASSQLKLALHAAGIPADLWKCRGFTGAAPQADPRWDELHEITWRHYVVRVGDTVIDLTRRQFFPDAPAVFVQPLTEHVQEWDEMHEDNR